MGTKAILDHHLEAFGAGDLDAILADYADDAVLITADGVVRGQDALRAVFSELLSGLFAPGTFEFVLDASHVEDDVAYLAWHAHCAAAEIPLATDTYVIRDGKIAVQTFAAKIDPK